MDLSKIENVQELKALAFDTIQRLEQEQYNLRAIQERLVKVQQAPVTEEE